ncbi:MAG TPA: prepilin-type N-terminal cleavage/methylation domain-containing protein [Mesotoga infera]|uniref:Prepilin-type N-terminal cleavage/methylation domain-containing protein n=1 Tax=Mesotoga infera TaxID=1236046 RepID=A0A7C1GSZ8_9BACT|nr:prepilin-type N-terminal cleavage/methylation domain-containing protein [Mesotoga infera]
MFTIDQSRKKGMTMTELLVALAISSVVLLIVTLVSTQSLRISRGTNASMTIDEQITKLHSSMNYLVSRQFAVLFSFGNEEEDEEPQDEPYSQIVVTNSIPSNVTPSGWETKSSLITFQPDFSRIVHLYEGKEGQGTLMSIIAEYVEGFEVSLITGTTYLSYTATFTYFDPVNPGVAILTKEARGAVRFY